MEKFSPERRPNLYRVTAQCDNCSYNVISITGEIQLNIIIDRMKEWVSHHEARFGHKVSFTKEISVPKLDRRQDYL